MTRPRPTHEPAGSPTPPELDVFMLRIATSNDAFQDGNRDQELARLLVAAAAKLRDDEESGSLLDINGNTVGTYGMRFTDNDGTLLKQEIPEYGEITAYRSPQDGALVIEVDTPEASVAAGTADLDTRPRVRIYVNDDPVWQNPPLSSTETPEEKP